MTRLALTLVLAAACGVAAVPAVAQVRGDIAISVGTRHGGHWHGGGWGPRVGIGIGFAAPIYYGSYYGPVYGPGYYAPAYPVYPASPLVVPPPVVYESGPVPPAPMTQPEPIFYPNRGQSAAKTEADRRECNRWAIGQPNAMGDASVFHRATLACMEGKGYTVR